jgi:LPS export ABC transporter protein LptC
MRRLALAILSVVGMFVLVVAGLLVARSGGARVEPPSAATNADLRIKDVNIREESGKVRWQLTAEQALVFEEDGRTSLRQIAVEVHEPDRSWTIVADEGDLFQNRKDLEVRHNVVLTSSDGLRLETSVLRWTGEEKRLWTDAPVRIIREGAMIRGTALDVRMDDSTTTVAGRVQATFSRGGDE